MEVKYKVPAFFFLIPLSCLAVSYTKKCFLIVCVQCYIAQRSYLELVVLSWVYA